MPEVLSAERKSYVNSNGERADILLDSLRRDGFALVDCGAQREVLDKAIADSKQFFQLARSEKERFAPVPGSAYGAGYVSLPAKEMLGIWGHRGTDLCNPERSSWLYTTLHGFGFNLLQSLQMQPLVERAALPPAPQPDVKWRRGKLDHLNETRSMVTYFRYAAAASGGGAGSGASGVSAGVNVQPAAAAGAPAHTDVGLLTLVYSESEGLEVLSPTTGMWAPVLGAGERHLVVLPGELLSAVTRGCIPAAIHRVVAPKRADRYSVVMRISGDRDATLPAGYRPLRSASGAELPAATVGEFEDAFRATRASVNTLAHKAAAAAEGGQDAGPPLTAAGGAEWATWGEQVAVAGADAAEAIAQAARKGLWTEPILTEATGEWLLRAAISYRSGGLPRWALALRVAFEHVGACERKGKADRTAYRAASRKVHLIVSEYGAEVHFKLRGVTPLRKVFDAFCEKRNDYVYSYSFLFDGQRVPPTSTPDDLDMKDDDRIDVMRNQCGD